MEEDAVGTTTRTTKVVYKYAKSLQGMRQNLNCSTKISHNKKVKQTTTTTNTTRPSDSMREHDDKVNTKNFERTARVDNGNSFPFLSFPFLPENTYIHTYIHTYIYGTCVHVCLCLCLCVCMGMCAALAASQYKFSVAPKNQKYSMQTHSCTAWHTYQMLGVRISDRLMSLSWIKVALRFLNTTKFFLF